MSGATIGITLGFFVLAATCYFWWRDFRQDRAVVQFIQGRFSEFPRETRPKAYWTITAIRGMVVILLSIALGLTIWEVV